MITKIVGIINKSKLCGSRAFPNVLILDVYCDGRKYKCALFPDGQNAKEHLRRDLPQNFTSIKVVIELKSPKFWGKLIFSGHARRDDFNEPKTHIEMEIESFGGAKFLLDFDYESSNNFPRNINIAALAGQDFEIAFEF